MATTPTTIRLDQPAHRPARKAVRKAAKRLHRRGRNFDALDDVVLHDVRLATKRLRYLLDLFASCLDEATTRRQRKALKALQSSLGQLNDNTLAAKLDRLATAGRAAPSVHALVDAIVAQSTRRRDLDRSAASTAWLELDASLRD